MIAACSCGEAHPHEAARRGSSAQRRAGRRTRIQWSRRFHRYHAVWIEIIWRSPKGPL